MNEHTRQGHDTRPKWLTYNAARLVTDDTLDRPGIDRLLATLDALLREHCQPATYTAAFTQIAELTATYARQLRNAEDLQFGRGYREGREAGRFDGWHERDGIADREREGHAAVINELRRQLAERDASPSVPDKPRRHRRSVVPVH